MATKTLTTEETNELLKKARKGTDSSFGVAQWAAVFNAIGWQTEIVKERTTIVGFNVTTSTGQKIAMLKEAQYRIFTFYRGTLNGKAWKEHTLRALLLAQTTFLADIEKVIGAEPVKEDFRRPNAPTCPCCFRDILLDTQNKMVHHGYNRPGYGFIVGDCFGVGYEPFEVSKLGTEEYLAQAIRPSLDRAKSYLAELLGGNVTSFPSSKIERGVEVAIVVTKETHPRDFERLLDRAIHATEGRISALTGMVKDLEEKIAKWAPKPLPEFIGNIPTMHYTAQSRKWGETGWCVAWGFRPKYVKHTTDKALVTCKRCQKHLEEEEKRASK